MSKYSNSIFPVKYFLPLFLLVLLLNKNSFSQNIAINTSGTAAHTSSILDLNTGNTFTSPNGKGLFIPNVALTGTADATTIASPATSLLVYNTATVGTGTLSTDVLPGFYYWNASKWVAFTGNGGSGWGLLGNAATVDGTNFIGTTDNIPFNIRVNNQRSGRIYSTGMTFFGYQAGNVNTTVSATGFGYLALAANTTGTDNTAFGKNALGDNTIGTNNTATGFRALWKNTTANQNTALGTETLNAQAFDNSGTAWNTDNVAVGFQALWNNNPTLVTNGYRNTAVGSLALLSNTTGSFNTALGYHAGDNITTGGSNIIIGYDIDAPVSTNSSQLSIGNLIFATGGFGTGTTIGAGNVGIATNAPGFKLDVNGPIRSGQNATDGQLLIYSEQGATDYTYTFNPNAAATQSQTYTLPPNDGASGQVLQTNGTGALTWEDPVAGTTVLLYNDETSASFSATTASVKSWTIVGTYTQVKVEADIEAGNFGGSASGGSYQYNLYFNGTLSRTATISHPPLPTAAVYVSGSISYMGAISNGQIVKIDVTKVGLPTTGYVRNFRVYGVY